MIHVFPSLAVRSNLLFNEGDFVEGHQHNFDHVTAVVRGSVRVECVTDKGEHLVKIVNAPDPATPLIGVEASMFNVPATWTHKIIALQPMSEFWCLYPPRDEQGNIIEKVDPYEGYMRAFG